VDRAGERYMPKIGDPTYSDDDALQVSPGGKLRL